MTRTSPTAAATALLLLNRSATAFQQCYYSSPISAAPPSRRILSGHRGGVIINRLDQSAESSFILFSAPPTSTSSLESIPSLESILDDGNGHINSELASAIYEWETAHTQTASGTIKEQFSTRDGLRLVDEQVRVVLNSIMLDDDDDEDNKATLSYNDLVQEGIIALLRAMSTFPSYKKSNTAAATTTTFKQYAKETIHSSFLQFVATSSRPIRLPLSLQTTLEAANTAAATLRNKLGKEPSLVQVANAINVKPHQLALYRKLYRKMVGRVGAFVSMEDGLEVYDPSLAGYVGTGLRPRSDSDNASASSSSSTLKASPTVITPSEVAGASSAVITASDDPTTSTLYQVNTQEDDWERQPPERIVAPLRDVLTDTEEINNPLSYTHHFILNEELNIFLSETLSSVEMEVIQLRFGLVDSKHGGRGWSAQAIGERLGLDREEVVKIASVALDKLRKAAATDDDAFVEVSL